MIEVRLFSQDEFLNFLSDNLHRHALMDRYLEVYVESRYNARIATLMRLSVSVCYISVLGQLTQEFKDKISELCTKDDLTLKFYDGMIYKL